ncbi:MAG: hypothetical protein R6X19_06145 [Kiritimatiellia bacterium]
MREQPIPIPERERQAREEIGRTDISPAQKKMLTAVFLLIVLGVPVFQTLRERGEPTGTGRRCQALAIVPAAWDDLRKLPEVGLFAANRFLLRDIDRYEVALNESSILREALLKPAQAFLTEGLRTGSEKVYTGIDGWLFFRSAVDHLTGAPFLDNGRMDARRHGAKAWALPPQPDPRLAIAEFVDQLSRRGITLILMPVPVKAAIHPERFTTRRIVMADGVALRNPSTPELSVFAAERGAVVFDAAASLRTVVRETGRPAFLKTDTHWTPEGMEQTATDLAALVKRRIEASGPTGTAPTSRAAVVTAYGDLVRMLGLPDNQRTYAPETVTILQVRDPEGGAWVPDSRSPVLLLGDSFANIYSDPMLGWGESAGLAERLSAHLGYPVDRISRNDDGAFATRAELAAEIRRGNDPLRGKRLVIWEFAERELSFGDWRSVALTAGLLKREGEDASETVIVEGVIVEGVIADMGSCPKPGSTPYRDHLTWLSLTGFAERAGMTQPVLAYIRTLEDGKQTAAASLRPGQKQRFFLQPWSEVKDRLGRIQREEPDNDDLLFRTPVFARLADDRAAGRAQQADPGMDRAALRVRQRFGELADQGHEMTVRGGDGWLFHRTELAQAAGGPFWGPAAADAGARERKPEQADPLAAIVAYDRACRALGIHLLVVPVPGKSAVYPDKLAEGLPVPGERRIDRAHAAFYEALAGEDVQVIDLVPELIRDRQSGEDPVFCRQDTHTSPRGIQIMAAAIARRVRTEGWLDDVPRRSYGGKKRAIEIRGDLRAGPDFDEMPDESLTVSIVIDPATGEPVQPDPASPVLLLSDSHGLIFSSGGDMHATGAGLPEHLAMELGFPVDVMAVRGSAARPARINLMRKIADTPGYIEKKKVIVWCFTVRELTAGAWGEIPLKR